MSVSIRRHALLAVCVLALGCRSRGDVADSARGDASAAPGTYTLGDFGGLRWLEGQWRGTLPDGKHFYERYRFVDDSTLVMHSFPDSTFGTPRDSSRVTLRGGRVSDGNSVATRLDSTGVDFAPHRGAGYNYSWAPESADKWNATVRGTDGSQAVVYPLHRVGGRP